MSTLLVDGDNLLTIGFYGVKDYYNKEQHIGGIYHFINTLRKSFDDFKLNKVCVFWDGDESSILRKKIYLYYKENRKTKQKTEEEKSSYIFQRTRIKQYLEELYVRQSEFEFCESDDCISYYVKNSPMEEKIIYSSDRDLLQLVNYKTRVYNPQHKKFYEKNSLINYNGVNILVENVKLVKILCGDSSDNISGIRNLGIIKLSKFLPDLDKHEYTLDEVKDVVLNLFEKDKNNNTLKNFLGGVSKVGILGEEFFNTNEKIIDLNNVFLTEEAYNGIIDMINENLDTEGRTYKNVMKYMMEDGIFNLLPYSGDKWTSFLTPFLKLTRIEKNKKLSKNF